MSKKLFFVGALLIAGCQQDATDVVEPVVVTEILRFEDGQEIVITRMVTTSPVVEIPTPAPTIFIEPSLVQLDIGQVDSYQTLDPQTANDQNSLNMIESLYAGLTNFNHATNTIEAELAQDWSVSSNGRVWTFYLRDDVYWVRGIPPEQNILEIEQIDLIAPQPVRRVVADDVVAGIRRACDSAVQTPFTFILFQIEGCEAVSTLTEASAADLAVIGVRAVNDAVVEIRLTEPNAAFLAITTLPHLRPVPADQLTDPEFEWLAFENLYTSGPFIVSPYSDPEPDDESDPVTILQRNPLWPTVLTKAGEVELIAIRPFDSLNEQYQSWRNYETDIVPLAQAYDRSHLDPPNTPPPFVNSHEVFYLGYNFDSRIFQNVHVRRAFSLAIDREGLIDQVYGGRGLPMRHFSPPGVAHAPPIDVPGLGYKADLALIEFNRSGYISCQALGEIRYMIDLSDLALQQAETLISMWVENLGCIKSQFKVEQVQFGTLLANTRATSSGEQRPDLFDLAWASFYPDAHNWFEPVLHCELGDNRSNRKSCEDVDYEIIEAGLVTDSAERTRLYRSIENRFFGENGSYPIAPLYVRGDYWLIQDWITTDTVQFAPATFGGEQYDTYRIDQRLKDLQKSQ